MLRFNYVTKLSRNYVTKSRRIWFQGPTTTGWPSNLVVMQSDPAMLFDVTNFDLLLTWLCGFSIFSKICITTSLLYIIFFPLHESSRSLPGYSFFLTAENCQETLKNWQETTDRNNRLFLTDGHQETIPDSGSWQFTIDWSKPVADGIALRKIPPGIHPDRNRAFSCHSKPTGKARHTVRILICTRSIPYYHQYNPYLFSIIFMHPLKSY